MTAPNATLARALAAIEFFEAAGRRVVGVHIEGRSYRLDFEPPASPDVKGVDLVNMGQ